MPQGQLTKGRLQIPGVHAGLHRDRVHVRTVGGRGGRGRRFPTVGPIASAGAAGNARLESGIRLPRRGFEGPTTLDRWALSGGSSWYVVAVAPPVVPTG
jgi:hypothetical protein